jgi:hypothetical protein
MNSKEFSSNAFVEGFAHFYAAQSFNAISYGADCEYQRSSVDWDLSGSAANDVTTFSCAGGFSSGTLTIDDSDYLGDNCLSTGYSDNRAAEYDFLRALWDMTTYNSASVDTIFDIWVAASPDDWNMTGNGTGSNYPSSRLSSGAYAVGGSTLQASWDWVASVNGTDR